MGRGTADGLTASWADLDGIASPTEWQNRETFAQITLEHLLGNQDSIPVTMDTALGIASIDRADQLITGQVSTFPLQHMTDGKRSTVQPLLFVQPEAGRPASQTWLWVTRMLEFYGRAFLIVRDRYADSEGGRPRRVEFAAEWNVQVGTAGEVVKAFGKPVAQRDVIRIDGPHSGFLNRPKVIRSAIAIEVAAYNAAANPVPSIDLHQTSGDPMDDTQVDAMIARWVAARTKRGTGGVGYTNQSIEARTLGIHPEQLLIAGRNASALDVARLTNLAPYWVGASVEGSAMTYQNVQMAGRELTDYTLAPYLTAIASRLSMPDVLPPRQTVQHVTQRLTRADLKETAETLRTLVLAKIITPEQAQRVLSGESIEAVL